MTGKAALAAGELRAAMRGSVPSAATAQLPLWVATRLQVAVQRLVVLLVQVARAAARAWRVAAMQVRRRTRAMRARRAALADKMRPWVAVADKMRPSVAAAERVRAVEWADKTPQSVAVAATVQPVAAARRAERAALAARVAVAAAAQLVARAGAAEVAEAGALVE